MKQPKFLHYAVKSNYRQSTECDSSLAFLQGVFMWLKHTLSFATVLLPYTIEQSAALEILRNLLNLR